jgi:hypothetical protein
MFKGHKIIDLAEGFAVPGCGNIFTALNFFVLHNMTEETTKLLNEISFTRTIYGFSLRNYGNHLAANEQAARNFIIKIFNELHEDDKRFPPMLKSEIVAYALKHSEKFSSEKKSADKENN